MSLVYEAETYKIQQLPFQSRSELQLTYKERILKQKYIPDFICFGKIILEIKAVTNLNNEHRAQVHNYLKATGYKVGLLVNFGHYPKVEHERIIRSCLVFPCLPRFPW